MQTEQTPLLEPTQNGCNGHIPSDEGTPLHYPRDGSNGYISSDDETSATHSAQELKQEKTTQQTAPVSSFSFCSFFSRFQLFCTTPGACQQQTPEDIDSTTQFTNR